MRGLSIFHKILFFINLLVVLLLLVACAAPHISSEAFSFLAFLSLGVPALVLANFLFLFYWLIQRKMRQTYPSLLILIFGYFALGTFIKLKFYEDEVLKEDLSVMSYNVRVFNMNKNIESETVFEDIKAFIDQEDPDILCFQEPGFSRIKEYENYPHRYLEYINMEDKGLLGILSKYPILNSGLINFPRTHSNACFADILYQNDTIRVYNTHLESLGITPGKGTLRNEPSDKLVKQLNRAFKNQLEQAMILKTHRASIKHRTIVCGDLNNNQFSNVYSTIKDDFQDTFVEKGKGYGRTLNFHGIPFRIDFILADESFEVKSHKCYDVRYSDHFPVMASFELRSKEN